MTDAEEPQFTTLAQRIAALNQSQSSASSGSSNAGASGKKGPPPPPPQRPSAESRNNSVNNPPISIFGSSTAKQSNNLPAGTSQSSGILPPPPVDRDQLKNAPQLPDRKVPPSLPSRTSPPQSMPALPPRRPSTPELARRRGSTDSMLSEGSIFSADPSLASTSSTIPDRWDGRKLPPTLDEANLPALPPTKRELAEKARLEKEAQLEKTRLDREAQAARLPLVKAKSAPVVQQMPLPTTLPPRIPAIPSLPPRVPARAIKAPVQATTTTTVLHAPAPRRLPPTLIPPVLARAALPTSSKIPATPTVKPPPIPYSSKPSQGQLSVRTVKPARAPRPRRLDECLICRDFSGPDSVAAQYPRLSNRDNSTDFLAEVLCGPFDSATDKARAIFTWLHFNIDYDVDAFFGGTVCHSSPENTISKGLAVCGGYAGVYTAIALKAGLECVTVTGHGKGYGHSNLQEGDPVPPPDPTGHAWNAVRIDDGEWKLIDSCWGAGHVNNQQYKRKFSPRCFTASNEDFGWKHFPSDNRYFLRADGLVPTWEEYIRGRNACEPLQLFGVVGEYGISEASFLPYRKQIQVYGEPVTRFQFSKMCAHWDHVRNGGGLPYCMILQLNGLDGRQKDFVPFDHDGMYWWVDIETRYLGCSPQTVSVYAVTTIGGRDGRGLSKDQYLTKRGREGMGFQTVATWELI